MDSSLVLGTAAAVVAPLLMAVGFTVWDVFWPGSAFMLNTLKCSLAAVLFVGVAGVLASQQEDYGLDGFGAGMLVLSGLLGIVIGDNAWLVALQSIGARRVILVDSIKPFAAALLALPIFGEPIRPLGMVGMAVTMSAVVIVSLEHEVQAELEDEVDGLARGAAEARLEGGAAVLPVGGVRAGSDSDEDEEDPPKAGAVSSAASAEAGALEPASAAASDSDSDAPLLGLTTASRLGKGYMYAAVNVLLDVCGSVITKKFGTSFNTFEIAGIRFGSSALVLFTVLGAFRASQRARRLSAAPPASAWWRWPPIERNPLVFVVLGVFSTTFLCPALQNYAIFQLPLGTFSTLMALTPIWSIPVVFVLKGERSSARAMVGSVVAFLGVIPLYIEEV